MLLTIRRSTVLICTVAWSLLAKVKKASHKWNQKQNTWEIYMDRK